MKKYFTAIIVLFVATNAFSQQLSQVTFSDASTLSYLSFMVDQQILVRVSIDGKVLEWGTEEQSMRSSTYYSPKLQPYLGRIEYFDSQADSAYRGKIKSIGTAEFTYFGHFDEPAKVGKLKSVGSLQLDYYSIYDNEALRGKLKIIGSALMDYYSSLEDEAYRGKLKAVSNTPITYYSTFDDKLIKGKIKSIGTASYTWYTSFDPSEYRGAMKTGSYRQNVGNVTYILR